MPCVLDQKRMKIEKNMCYRKVRRGARLANDTHVYLGQFVLRHYDGFELNGTSLAADAAPNPWRVSRHLRDTKCLCHLRKRGVLEKQENPN